MQLTNEKSGETLQTSCTHQEAAARFGELFAGQEDHWLWFWIHRAVQGRQGKNGQGGPAMNQALALIADTFVYSIGQGLKRPMIRLAFRDQRFKLYLSARGTVCLKSGMVKTAGQYHCHKAGHPQDCKGCTETEADWGQPVPTKDPVGDEWYVGCLLRGAFLPAQLGNFGDRNRPTRPLTATEAEFLKRLQESPIEFMAQCSRDLNRCCYCNNPLTDERSKKVGYGETCADRWGLPWGTSSYMEKAPSFAKAYCHGAPELCDAIRCTPREHPDFVQVWAVFGDWLEEQGLPRCEVPEEDVVLPRGDSTVRASAPKPALPKVPETPKAQVRMPAPAAASKPAQPKPAAPTITPATVLPAPAPKPGLVEVSTVDMVVFKDGTLQADASDLGIVSYPDLIRVTSHKSGASRDYSLVQCVQDEEGDVTHAEYVSQQGGMLRVIND